jgi:hypothetical protein
LFAFAQVLHSFKRRILRARHSSEGWNPVLAFCNSNDIGYKSRQPVRHLDQDSLQSRFHAFNAFSREIADLASSRCEDQELDSSLRWNDRQKIEALQELIHAAMSPVWLRPAREVS